VRDQKKDSDVTPNAKPAAPNINTAFGSGRKRLGEETAMVPDSSKVAINHLTVNRLVGSSPIEKATLATGAEVLKAIVATIAIVQPVLRLPRSTGALILPGARFVTQRSETRSGIKGYFGQTQLQRSLPGCYSTVKGA